MNTTYECNWFWVERKYWDFIISVIISLIFAFIVVKVCMCIFNNYDGDNDIN